MASAPDDGAPTPPSAVPAPSPVADVPDPSPPPAASRVPDGTGAFVQDALRRCGMRWDRVVVHLDRAIVQANATVVPVTTHDKVLTTKDRHGVTVPRDVPAIIGTRHLVVKFVHILETTFRDDEHRERTRASYACECAFYRARQRAPGSRGADAGQWATPFTYLVEGDAQSDTFVIVMDDVSKLKPGVAERARARARKNAEARAVENDVRGDNDEGDDEDGATADGDGATADEDGATADAAAGTTTPPMGASFERASAALEWLASFHAHWWRDLPDAPAAPAQLWPRGGYWTLEKRESDLDGLETEWAKLLAAFHDDETLAAHRTLAARLRAAASAVAREGARGEIGAPSHPGGGGTVVHGDFKLANIIFPPVAEVRDAAMDASGAATDVVDDRGRRRGAQPSAPDPAVIDWQWAGPGAAAQDVLYFFATSLSLDALHRADELLARYHARLVADLRARGEAGTAAAEAYDLDRLSRDIDVQATDYARFAMGSMWGEVTPESMARDAPKQNVGMHRRSLPHLHWLVRRAAKGLDAMECKRPGDAPPPDPDAPPKRPEKDPAPKRGGPVARLVAELLGTCVFLADEAGDIVRGVAERGHLGVVRDKSDASGVNAAKSPAKKRAKKKSSADAPAAVAVDPQTQADRRAERLIVSALRRTFGSVVRVVGEESSEGALAAKGETNADGTVDAVDADVPAASLAAAARGGHGSVRAWEILLPPGLEVGPARAARLREKYPDEPHAACAESDVVVWVDPLDGTREFVEGPEHWSGVTTLMGVSVGGIPVAGVIHQPFVGADGVATVRPEDLEPNEDGEVPKLAPGAFGRGRTLWGAPGLGVFAHPGREPLAARVVAPPRPADVKALRVATTRSHQTPAVEGAVYNLAPVEVIRAGGAGGKVALMLDGKVDAWVFPARGTKRWDTCAGEALLTANRGGWLAAAMTGAAYDYGSESERWPGNIDGVIAATDEALYAYMAHKWPWLNDAGGERKGPRDPGLF